MAERWPSSKPARDHAHALLGLPGNSSDTHVNGKKSVVIRFFVRALFSFVGLAVVAYAFFFIPLGRRTVFEHTMRILATEPAQELGDEAVQATDRLTAHIEAAWEARYAPDAGAP